MPSQRTAVVSLIAYLLVRIAFLLIPGYSDDLTAYKRWAVAGAIHGLSQVYRQSDMDYPPLYAYALTPLGKLYLELLPDAHPRGAPGYPALWTALVKLPPLVFDLLTGWLLWRLGRRHGSPWDFTLPAAYLLNPAVLFDTGYWGHPDSIHSFFVLAAVLAVSRSHTALAFALLSLGTLMKPLGAPFFPLLFLLAWLRHGIRAAFVALAATIATTVTVFAPYLVAGEGRAVIERVAADVDRMPLTSVNAHNVWWLLGPWRGAEDALLGPLTATQLGLLAFAIVYLMVVLRVVRGRPPEPRAPDEPQSLLLAALIGFSFFMLVTHMHENHLFTVLPLLAAVLPAGRRFQLGFAAVSLGVLLNLVLHDQQIPGRWPFTIGGATDFPRPSHGRTFFAAELACVWVATLWNVAVFAGSVWETFRRRSGFSGLADGDERREDDPSL